MNGKMLVLSAVVVCSVSSFLYAKEPAKTPEQAIPIAVPVPSQKDIARIDRMTTLVADYGTLSVMIGNQQRVMSDSKELFNEKSIPAEDCIKMAQSVNTVNAVLLKRSASIKDASLRSQVAEYINDLISGNNAYIKYYKGDIQARSEAEKFWQQADSCNGKIQKYIQGE